MIGVDIVDHKDPLLRKRDERSFRLIRNTEDRHSDFDISEEQLFWLYWVAKEATYKAIRKRVRFDPKKIPVKISKYDNIWCFQSENINGILEQNSNYTFGICALSNVDLNQLNYQIFDCRERDQSAGIRKRMVKSLIDKGKGQVSLAVDEMGLPAVRYDGDFHLATFTHHHHLMAYICE